MTSNNITHATCWLSSKLFHVSIKSIVAPGHQFRTLSSKLTESQIKYFWLTLTCHLCFVEIKGCKLVVSALLRVTLRKCQD